MDKFGGLIWVRATPAGKGNAGRGTLQTAGRGVLKARGGLGGTHKPTPPAHLGAAHQARMACAGVLIGAARHGHAGWGGRTPIHTGTRALASAYHPREARHGTPARHAPAFGARQSTLQSAGWLSTGQGREHVQMLQRQASCYWDQFRAAAF